MATAITLVGAAGSVRAQSPEAPSDVAVRVGPLALAPAIRLGDLGHDSNVYNRDINSNPKGDVTARLSPSVDGWLRLSHVRANGRSQFDFFYFKELTGLRALDTDTAARVELMLNRLTPFLEGNLTNTRHRQNLEIDAIARRRNNGAIAGADLSLTEKVSAGAYVRRSSVEYESNSLYLGTDLAHEINHTSVGEGVAVHYRLTPYTTFALGMERQRDRFASGVNRDADSIRVAPSVEFSPNALVGGRASIGFRRLTFLTGGAPGFNGTSMLVDLYYTLLGQTRFGVQARRDPEYSYITRAYVDTEITVSVTQRLGESWDVGGNLGRARLTYGLSAPTNQVMQIPDETVPTYSADVGYRMGHTTVGFHVEHRARQTDLPVPFRSYQRLRVGSSVTYVF